MARSYSENGGACLGVNDEVVASLDGILPASSGIFTCLPAGNELFQSGAAESMRSNACPEAEERGECMSCTNAAASCTMAMPVCLSRA